MKTIDNLIEDLLPFVDYQSDDILSEREVMIKNANICADIALHFFQEHIINAFENGKYNAHLDNPDRLISGSEYFEKEFK